MDKKKHNSNKRNRTPDLIKTKRGERPVRTKDSKGNLVDYLWVGDSGGISLWQKASVLAIPTCDSIVREIKTSMIRDPEFRAVNHFTDNGLSDFYSANPNLVIDSMNILMASGELDRFDFDEVFDQVHPFSETEWEIDRDHKAFLKEQYMSLSDEKLDGYPKKGERTEEDFNDWLDTKPVVEVKSWAGKVKANDKDFNVRYCVARIKNRRHPKTKRTNYFVGNRIGGDKPILFNMLNIPGTSAPKYIRGRPSKTNMLAYPKRKKVAQLRKKARSGMVNDVIDTTDVLNRLKAGESFTL